MKAKDLIAGNWYKFFTDDKREYHIKSEGNNKCSKHLDNNKKLNGTGVLDTSKDYTPSLPEEINKFLPEEEQIKNNFEIY